MASVTPTRATIRLRRAVSRATSACESVGDPKDSPRDASTNAAARDEERRARETTVAVASATFATRLESVKTARPDCAAAIPDNSGARCGEALPRDSRAETLYWATRFCLICPSGVCCRHRCRERYRAGYRSRGSLGLGSTWPSGGRTESSLGEGAAAAVLNAGVRALVVLRRMSGRTPSRSVAPPTPSSRASGRRTSWSTTRASRGPRQGYEATDEANWDAVMAVNLKGVFLVTRACLGPMRNRGAGRFVTVASISATLGGPGLAAYCASKWGAVGFTKSLAEELRGSGLQAFSVLPGSVGRQPWRRSEASHRRCPLKMWRGSFYSPPSMLPTP